MKKSVLITKEAKNSSFVDCVIYGGVENSGKNTLFRKTIIGLENKLEKYPVVYGVTATVIGGIILFFVNKLLEKI